ncbi:MAG TPA: tetratricopeptide repeat protein, partial [Lacipirellulaceae bacterium]|nr:tetratricopeptide repeat protein [Lacipirellulaceae bacterium]
ISSVAITAMVVSSVSAQSAQSSYVRYNNAAVVASDLGSTDPKTRAAAAEALRQRFIPEWRKAGEHARVTAFAFRATLAVPQFEQSVQQFCAFRARALLAQGRPDEALAAAKQAWLVAPMVDYPDAVVLVVECLRAAGREDEASAFQFGQIRLLEPSEGVGQQPDLLGQISLGTTSPYREAAATRQGNTFGGWYERGNLLLLSGDIDGARMAFEKARDVATNVDAARAHAGVARCIRARMGLGAANKYLGSN